MEQYESDVREGYRAFLDGGPSDVKNVFLLGSIDVKSVWGGPRKSIKTRNYLLADLDLPNISILGHRIPGLGKPDPGNGTPGDDVPLRHTRAELFLWIC
ncbi:hypothetical protein BDD14_5624 [Edaphobacter modestus]|uniref:Uncharacterized protein n=1 Tax=Edaphobacter modestus TaxID=388466 RepID=A0A4Q7YEZ5_9BACT|nr:hypothetical protein BDD14_5624 [Edaphobacter modestus]